MDVKREVIVNDLKRILGDEKVFDDEALIRLYGKDAIFREGSAIALVLPESVEDVSKLLSYAYKNDLKIYPQGSATDLVGSSTPHSDGIILNLQRMNRIKEISVVDSYVVTEPGVRLFELNNVLSDYGYMFPVDPGSVKSASVGGAINSGAGGMMGAKYGTMKDYVLELQVVLPDENGTIMRIGSKTTKSRQGYDLVRLIVGSEGTLAVVTEATLKIVPIPENVVTIAGFFPSLEDLAKAVIDIKKSRFDILIMEFVDDLTVKSALENTKTKIRGEGNMLITSVITSIESADRVLNSLEEIFKLHGATKVYKARTQQESDELGLMDIRRNYYAASIQIAAKTRKKETNKIIVYPEDISVPPSKLVEAVRRIRELEKKYGIPMTLAGHISDGNIHPNIWVEEEDKEKLELLPKLIADIMRIGIELGGTMSSEHGIGTTKKEGLIEELEHKGGLKALELMRGIKRLFDPKGILNPDKVL